MKMNIELTPETIDELAKLITPKVLTMVQDNIQEDVIGKIINLDEFNDKYVKKTPKWIKQNIFYEFQPDWVEDIHPGKGKAFRIHEYAAKEWMEEHRHQIDWSAKEL